jgi:ParB-like chromosome segregation protein Spo0J
MKKIINKVTNCETINWKELKTYEFNTLKDQTERDVTKLKNSIVNNGFTSPFYIWADHNYVIDGTGRQLALLELEKEGLEIPN